MINEKTNSDRDQKQKIGVKKNRKDMLHCMVPGAKNKTPVYPACKVCCDNAHKVDDRAFKASILLQDTVLR